MNLTTQNSKNIVILGATGSIGTQALEVIAAHPDRFQVYAISAQNSAELLVQQALQYHPKYVIITNVHRYVWVKQALQNTDIQVLAGEEGLNEVVSHPDVAMVLTALVGFSGLKPTISAIKAGKNIALANKETLVVAGDLVMQLAKKHQVSILPVDSEHSAIFQCLVGEEEESVEKIILTASGGPFRGKDSVFLEKATRNQALKHPNWVMGAKITIDSASLMNKGLEVIEAKWLFDLPADKIEVIVHPQSIIHSLVQFKDGSMKAQLGLPDMKLPIHYALNFPERVATKFERFDFLKYPQLSFETADLSTFRNLALAYEALKIAGNMPCILNAANEMAVAAFLNEQIGFLQMSDIIAECMQQNIYMAQPDLDNYVQTDRITRIFAQELINKI